MEFRDLKAQYNKYRNEFDQAIKNVLIDSTFIGGKEVTNLEKRLSDYVGVKHCITCSNGTDAMSLVLMAWNLQEGDAVFVPDFTFFATAEVVSLRGATPVFVDVEKSTFNMDYIDLEEKINMIIEEGILVPRVIIPVDLFGLPANYVEIQKIAEKYNLKILEDGAQGFGGSFDGKKACSFGDAATTSFFPAKPLGCYGDGGAIFTNNTKLSKLLESLKVHGKGINKYDNIRVGLNSRLDTIQAAILNVKLTAFINHELDDVNRIYTIYNTFLDEIVITPKIPKKYISSFAQYTIILDNKEERDMLQKALKKEGVPSMIYYSKPLSRQVAFSSIRYNKTINKNSIFLADRVLSLPIHPYLSKKDTMRIINIIKYCLNNYRK